MIDFRVYYIATEVVMHKEFFINQLKIDEEFTDFFLVKSIAIRIGSNR